MSRPSSKDANQWLKAASKKKCVTIYRSKEDCPVLLGRYIVDWEVDSAQMNWPSGFDEVPCTDTVPLFSFEILRCEEEAGAPTRSCRLLENGTSKFVAHLINRDELERHEVSPATEVDALQALLAHGCSMEGNDTHESCGNKYAAWGIRANQHK
jgi:hypothetical protein